MTAYKFTLVAHSELLEIIEFIASESGPDRAEAVVSDIERAAARLAEYPEMGHKRSDLTDEPLRFWSIHRFLLIYRPSTRPLEFIHIVSGWRDVEALLRGE